MKNFARFFALILLLTALPPFRVHSDTVDSPQKSRIQRFRPIRIIVDRFEGRFAVVELSNQRMVNMPKDLIPRGSKEGSLIRISVINREESKNKRITEGN